LQNTFFQGVFIDEDGNIKMDIRLLYVGGALALLLIIVILASLYLSRKARLRMYVILAVGAAAVWAYVTFNLNYLPSAYVLET
jgi:hypothetical protein